MKIAHNKHISNENDIHHVLRYLIKYWHTITRGPSDSGSLTFQYFFAGVKDLLLQIDFRNSHFSPNNEVSPIFNTTVPLYKKEIQVIKETLTSCIFHSYFRFPVYMLVGGGGYRSIFAFFLLYLSTRTLNLNIYIYMKIDIVSITHIMMDVLNIAKKDNRHLNRVIIHNPYLAPYIHIQFLNI